ncbi:MAG TPA: hypothetical protein DDW47_04945, partial [Lactobacillus acetotolerans]|nr:hypothetical protein [Lactobacillus acetotolerans]
FIKIAKLDGKNLKTSNGYWITSKKKYTSKTKGYQNPKKYHQVYYHQIKPTGKIGHHTSWYNLSRMSNVLLLLVLLVHGIS